MHKPKVEFNKKFFNLNQMCNKELKNSPKEIREREREYSLACVSKIQIEQKREQQIFIIKKKGGEEESK